MVGVGGGVDVDGVVVGVGGGVDVDGLGVIEAPGTPDVDGVTEGVGGRVDVDGVTEGVGVAGGDVGGGVDVDGVTEGVGGRVNTARIAQLPATIKLVLAVVRESTSEGGDPLSKAQLLNT